MSYACLPTDELSGVAHPHMFAGGELQTADELAHEPVGEQLVYPDQHFSLKARATWASCKRYHTFKYHN